MTDPVFTLVLIGMFASFALGAFTGLATKWVGRKE